jgi:hypothetical protein
VASEPVGRFLDVALASFRAAAGDTSFAFDFVIGESDPLRIRFRVARPLAHLLPALAWHAQPLAGSADIHIFAFDGPGLPAPPWSKADYLPRGEVRGCTSGRFRATVSVGDRILNLFDRDRAVGVFWCEDAARLPSWEPGAPLRHLLHWALADRGWQLIHAAAAGLSRGAALLAGPGGSGKSTATFACLRAGMLSVGDDYCVVASTGEPPRAHALFDTGKLAADSLAHFPLAVPAGRSVGADGDKTHVRLSAAFPEGHVSRLPLRAIVLPRVAERTGTPVRVSAAQAARTLAPSTLMQLPGARTAALQAIGRLTRALPSFHLDVGPDLDTIPGVIARLLEDVGR